MDGDDDNKPFSCTSSGCRMRFTNEDHLTVHLKKHEMSLTLNCTDDANESRIGRGHNLANNNNNNNSTLFVDQTPTPTRFIRNCEEVGLFQDLQNVNPFEDHFRKAVEATKIGNSLPTIEPLRVSADSDILHTPSVLTADLETVNQLVDNCVVNNDLDTPVPHVGTDDTLILCETEQDNENDQVTVIVSSSTPSPPIKSNSSASINADEPIASSYNDEDENLSILPTTESSNDRSKVTYTITSSSRSNSQSMTTTTINTTPCAGAADIVQQVPTGVLSTDVGNIVQFILRLPDGRCLPVSLPSMSMLVASTTDTPRQTPATTFAKQILKNTLTGSQMATTSGMTKAVGERQMGASDFMNFDSTSNDSDSHDKQLSDRKRSFGGREHSDEKRMKFLERNRAAATRCRQKRKQWVQNLESKADELNSVNQQLQNEVTSLRNEVAQLKSMLLAHKDCPVTQQQKVKLNGLCTTPAILIHKDSNLEVIRIGAAEDVIASSALTNRTQTVHLVGVTNATTTVTATPVIVRTVTQARRLRSVPSVQSDISGDPATLLSKALTNAENDDGHIVITIEDEHLDEAGYKISPD